MPGFEICGIREKVIVSIWEWCTQGGEGNLQRWKGRDRGDASQNVLASGGSSVCLTEEEHERISCGNGNVLWLSL